MAGAGSRFGSGSIERSRLSESRFTAPRRAGGAAFSVSLTGLTDGEARVGDHATISYTTTPVSATETVKWSNSADPAAAATYGTGANPTDYTAGDEGALWLHVTDTIDEETSTVSRSAPIRYAPGAAPSIADGQTFTVDTAITAIDASASGANLTFTYALTGGPAGLSINASTGSITGTPSAVSSGTATVTATDQYGRTLQDTFTFTASLRAQATGGTDLDLAFVEDSAIASTDLVANWTTNGNTLTFVSVSPALPTGLSINSAGTMTGTPATVTADTTYTLTMQDEYNRQTSDTFTLEITEVSDIAPPDFVADFQLNSFSANNSALTISDVIDFTISGPGIGTTVDSDGVRKWGAHNLVVNSDTPATQTIGPGDVIQSLAYYTIGCTGTGSVAISGGASGTVTAGNDVEVQVTGGGSAALTLTVSGDVDTMWCFRSDLGGMQASPITGALYVPTGASPVYHPRLMHDANGGVIGLMSEKTVKNFFKNTATLDGTGWSFAAGATVTYSNNVARVQFSGSQNFQQLVPTGSNRNITISAEVRSTSGGSDQSFRLKCTHAAVINYFSDDLTATSEWKKFSFTAAHGSGGDGAFAGVVPNTAGDAADIEVRYLQIEEASFASEFVPTIDPVVEKPADVIRIKADAAPSSGSAISMLMHGEFSYKDSDAANEVTILEWGSDSANRIYWTIDTTGEATGRFVFAQVASGTEHTAASGALQISEGMTMGFSAAARHTTSIVSGAEDGVIFAEETGPTTLPNLSAQPITVFPSSSGVITRLIGWKSDIGQSALGQVSLLTYPPGAVDRSRDNPNLARPSLTLQSVTLNQTAINLGITAKGRSGDPDIALTTQGYTHPKMVYDAAGWNGYKYWMAITPHWGPIGTNAEYENPHVVASNDLETWVEPSGGRIDLPEDGGLGFYSDTHLWLDGGTLHLWYRARGFTGRGTYIIHRSSTNGTSWSTGTIIQEASVAPFTNVDEGNLFLSPAIFYDGTQWVYYDVLRSSAGGLTIPADGVSTADFIFARTGASPDASFGTYALTDKVSIDRFSSTDDPWHMDAIKCNDLYVAAVTDKVDTSIFYGEDYNSLRELGVIPALRSYRTSITKEAEDLSSITLRVVTGDSTVGELDIYTLVLSKS